TDSYNSKDYTIQPSNGTAGELQTERVNVHNGTNIYDAAVWQIAVELGSVVNQFKNLVSEDAYALIANQSRLLVGGPQLASPAVEPATGEVEKTTRSQNRALTRGELFIYNGHSITDPNKAYSFRMVAPGWLVDDPLMGSRYATFITARELPSTNPEYKSGRI